MIKTDANRNYLVEVWFPIEKDEDGYPRSKEWEQLLAHPTDNLDEFRLESVPFYLKNVSRGDSVKAKIAEVNGGKIFEFDFVVNRGGHNTYRLLLRGNRTDDPDFTVNELTKKGLAVEQQGKLLALDVPPYVQQSAIDEYLTAQTEAGRWEMQDGYLHGIKTSRTRGDLE